MNNQQIIAVLRQIEMKLNRRIMGVGTTHGVTDDVTHLITSLSEPGTPVTTTPTDDESVNF